MKTYQKILNAISNFIFLYVVVLVLMAFFKEPSPGEANIGSFDTIDFNTGWEMTVNGQTTRVELPYRLPDAKGNKVLFQNTLPSNIHDGMQLCLRSDMEDVAIYIAGSLVDSYGSTTLPEIGIYPPSAYLFVPLSAEDAGKDITLEYVVKKNTGKFAEITIGNGNNAWYDIVGKNIVELIMSIIMIVIGFLAILLYCFFRWKLSANRSVLFLGQTIIMLGIWVLSESKIRQLFFQSPSLSMIFCYVSLEVLAVYVLFYFDEMQSYTYHKTYNILESLCLGQLLINMILSVTGVMEHHDTLKFAHIWIVVGVVVASILMIKDVKSGRVKKYDITAIGMFFFIVTTLLEVIAYYITNAGSLGLYLCIGFILLLVATILQTLADVYRTERKHREHVEKATLTTIETIASSIDAKDEYTGGHSERVAHYATILAEAIASDYGFDSKDLIRIHYIALMHDIGKIGIPDVILNKAGRLTDDEYVLMKRHATIGDSLLKDIDTIEDLNEGVRHHHERYDGKGYPDGLAGEDIPLIARILCLADCFDAMTSNRVYRVRLTDEQVRDEIEKCAGTQFDPKLAKVFCELLDTGKITVLTQRGFEVKENGEVLKSSLLRRMLVEDLVHDKHEISNPSFVRMVSYIVKMAEKQDQDVHIYLIGIDEGTNSEQNSLDTSATEATDMTLKKCVDKEIKPIDISIAYSKLVRLVVWFDIPDEEVEEKLTHIQSSLGSQYKLITTKVNLELIQRL